MDTGRESDPYVIEPIEDPVPGRQRDPVPDQPLPDIAPDVAPERVPELVPA